MLACFSGVSTAVLEVTFAIVSKAWRSAAPYRKITNNTCVYYLIRDVTWLPVFLKFQEVKGLQG